MHRMFPPKLSLQEKKLSSEKTKLSSEETKLSFEETEKLYQQVSKMNATKDNKSNQQLKDLISNGQGFYAAIAVGQMCHVISQNAARIGGGDSTFIYTANEQKKPYIEIALKKNTVAGQFILVSQQLSDPLISTKLSEISANIEKFKSYITYDTESYKKLTAEVQKQINDDLKEMLKQPDEYQEKIALLKKLKSPLQVLEMNFAKYKKHQAELSRAFRM